MSKKKCVLLSIVLTFVVTVTGIFSYLNFATPAVGLLSLRHIILNSAIEGTDAETLDRAAYDGMLSSLQDPYAQFFTPAEYKMFIDDLNASYSGIGMTTSYNAEEDCAVVINVFKNSPASRADIRPGDAIVKIEKTPVTAENFTEMISVLRGENGDNQKDFEITLSRGGEEITVFVRPEEIEMDTVFFTKIEDIAYVQITAFDSPTFSQFKETISSPEFSECSGMILDLRNNPGGLLTSVVAIADMLLPECDIVYTMDKAGKKSYYKSDAECIDIPTVILINGHTASASEVLTGALRDIKKTPTVGTKSYGKGCVQNLLPLFGKGAVKLTTSYYYSPSGICIQGTGFTPDYEVELPDSYIPGLAPGPDLEQDTQLIKALEVIKDRKAVQTNE